MRKSIYTVEQIDALLSAKGMAFQGAYVSVDEISAPVDGGHYYIGTEGAYSVYTYINGAWVNAGSLMGPPGEKGEKGDPFTYEDFTEEQLDALESGAKAAQAAAEEAAESAENAAQAAAEQAVVHAEGVLQVYVASAENAKNEAQAAAQNAAEEAAEVAATEAVQHVETKMAGYVSDAEQAKGDAQNAAESAAKDAVAEVETEMAGYVSAAEAAKAAAEQARDDAQGIVGGDFATKEEAQGYAGAAEINANSYTDEKIAAIPTPDVSGQINAHNTDAGSHADIRKLIVQSDWSQNDESAPEYVQNRTHYVEPGDWMLANDTYFHGEIYTFTVDESGFSSGVEVETSVTGNDGEYDGCKFKVTWNETVYEVNHGAKSENARPELGYDRDDLPFVINTFQDFTILELNTDAVTYAPGTYEVTVKIEVLTPDIYHTIPLEYLPSNVATTTYVASKVSDGVATRAPSNHATTMTIYGTGTASKYGHVKLSSAVDSTNGESNAVAATPSAVKAAYDRSATLMNRTTAVNAADTSYTTLMARGSSLHSADTTPAVNGAISWTYK